MGNQGKRPMGKRIRDTWTRFLTWLRALSGRLLGRTPPINPCLTQAL